MTWRTQLGERTLKGAEAELIREALGHVIDMVDEEIAGYADPWQFGVMLFDRLEQRARLALLADVGWALLRETDVCPKLTAISESGVAVLFMDIEQSIQFEIDTQDDSDDPFFWRSRILAIFQEDGDTTDLPAENSNDWSEWETLMEVLSERILWDNDFNDADQFLDSPPDQAHFLRALMTIDDEYYRAIPPDPKDEDLSRIRNRLRELYHQ